MEKEREREGRVTPPDTDVLSESVTTQSPIYIPHCHPRAVNIPPPGPPPEPARTPRSAHQFKKMGVSQKPQ